LVAEFPERGELAQAHVQRAASLARLGQTEAAVQAYSAALQSERNFPNVRTNAWVDFGWLVVERQLTDYYDEALHVLQEFRDERGLRFPVIKYRYAAIQALLADYRGDKPRAREFARQAIAEAAKDHSGLRYHPTVGLVGSERDTFANRLRMLAGS
jgi:tetratricopeptide (TPR) repeat protein